MSSSDAPGSSKAVKEEPKTKFIHSKPGEQPTSPKLFVSNAPEDGELHYDNPCIYSYDLTFANLAEFEAWRRQEEETHTVEFVKGDTHGSRTNPPRFKEHVKLVCARHTRRGRKQYIKKHPERTRKTPSRKIDGLGCPATICYKTYVDTEVVRAMYNREHSHPIGLENLPFTRKGQKALNSARPKTMPRIPTTSVTSTSEDESGASSVRSPTVSAHGVHLSAGRPDLFTLSPPPPDPNGDMFVQRQAFGRLSSIPSSNSRSSYARPLDHQPPHDYRSPPISTSLESSSPTSHVFQDPSLGYDLPPELPPLRLPEVPTANDRWERLAVLFRSVHSHALTFDYPDDSVNALESMLVRLYLESPLVGGMLREEGTATSMEELGLGVLGEAELGIPGIEGPGVNPLADLDTIGIIGDTGIGMPTAHQNTQLHLPPHLRPH